MDVGFFEQNPQIRGKHTVVGREVLKACLIDILVFFVVETVIAIVEVVFAIGRRERKGSGDFLIDLGKQRSARRILTEHCYSLLLRGVGVHDERVLSVNIGIVASIETMDVICILCHVRMNESINQAFDEGIEIRNDLFHVVYLVGLK